MADNIALARNRTHDRGLANGSVACIQPLAAMFIALFPADICFVDFDDTHKFFEIIVGQSSAESMARKPHAVR